MKGGVGGSEADSEGDELDSGQSCRSGRRRRITFPAQVRLLCAVRQQENSELARLLAQHGSRLDVNAANNAGMSLLQQATLNRNLDTVKLLLCAGADVNVQDINGFAPLHTAAYYGFRQAASLLIVFGADLFQMTIDGDMAVDLAKDNATIDMLTQEMRRQLQNKVFLDQYGFIFRGIVLWERFLVWSKEFIRKSASAAWNAAVAQYVQYMKDRTVTVEPPESVSVSAGSDSNQNETRGCESCGEEKMVGEVQGKKQSVDSQSQEKSEKSENEIIYGSTQKDVDVQSVDGKDTAELTTYS